MMRGLLLIFLIALMAWPAALVRGADAPSRGVYAKQLASECDALMQAAVRRPYGWGWDNVTMATPARSTAPRHVALEPLGTPAAGLILLWSGQLLDEPKYRQAAIDTARGIAAAQMTTGKIPLHAIFGTTAGGRDEISPVPERAATRAGLVVMLSVLESSETKPELVSRATRQAAQWLIKQQAADGGWPTAYSLTVSPDKRESLRIIRLDDPDFRDSTYAMLLAAEALNDRTITRSAEDSVQKLLWLRLGVPHEAPTTQEAEVIPQPMPDSPSVLSDASIDRRTTGLWSTVYRMSGAIDPAISEFPEAADIPASHYAMQTLLGAYLLTGQRPAGLALDSASQALVRLRQPDGKWQRIYTRHPTTAPATTEPTVGMFGPPSETQDSTFGLDPTLTAIAQLKSIGRDRYTAMLTGQFTIKQQLAATVCGLMSDPLTLDLPAAKSEIQAYIQKHQADWAILEGPMPEDLGARLKRLWVLLIRAKLEQRQ